MKITGYKVYFDGEKFIAEHEESEVTRGFGSDETVWWFDTARRAAEEAKEHNEHLKLTVEEMQDKDDFVVYKCKECGDFFLLSKENYEWYKSRELAVPKRCGECRRKRRAAAKDAHEAESGKKDN